MALRQRGLRAGGNFNKVLIGSDGTVIGTWGSNAAPMAAPFCGAVEGALVN